MNETTCRACGAKIAFVQTRVGKAAPVNLPAKKVFIMKPDGMTSNCEPIFEVVEGFESHFATCPDAAKFRKKLDSKPEFSQSELFGG